MIRLSSISDARTGSVHRAQSSRVSHTRLRSYTAVGGNPLKKSGARLSEAPDGLVWYRNPSMNSRFCGEPEGSSGPSESIWETFWSRPYRLQEGRVCSWRKPAAAESPGPLCSKSSTRLSIGRYAGRHPSQHRAAATRSPPERRRWSRARSPQNDIKGARMGMSCSNPVSGVLTGSGSRARTTRPNAADPDDRPERGDGLLVAMRRTADGQVLAPFPSLFDPTD